MSIPGIGAITATSFTTAIEDPENFPTSRSVGAWILDDSRVCLTNNAAERAPRGVALGRKSWLFAGSKRGDRAAFMYSLIVTAEITDVEPQA